MAEALQAAVDLAGDLAVGIVEAVEHVLDGAALGEMCRSSMVTSSVTEKQSCTSIRLICSRGFSMPASW